MLSHDHAGTEDIPLGLLREGGGVAAQVLSSWALASTGSASRLSSVDDLGDQ